MAAAIGYTLLLIALAIYLQGKYAPFVAAWKRERLTLTEQAGVVSTGLIGSTEPSLQTAPRKTLLLQRYADCGTVKVTLQAKRTDTKYEVFRTITVYRIVPGDAGGSTRERIGVKALPIVRIDPSEGLNLPGLMERTIDEYFRTQVPTTDHLPVAESGTRPLKEKSKERSAPKQAQKRQKHAYVINQPITGLVTSAEFSEDRKGFTVSLEKDGVVRQFTGKDLEDAFKEGKVIVGEEMTLTYLGKRQGKPIDGEYLTRNCFEISSGNSVAA